MVEALIVTVTTAILCSCPHRQKLWEVVSRTWTSTLSLLGHQTKLILICLGPTPDCSSLLLPEHRNISLPGTKYPLADVPQPVMSLPSSHLQFQVLLKPSFWFCSMCREPSYLTFPLLTRVMVFLWSWATCTSSTSHIAIRPCGPSSADASSLNNGL